MSRKEPVYSKFPIIEETCVDGWYYGAITEFEDPNGCTDGDGFVQAPDGSRAGLVWDYVEGKISKGIRVISAPDEIRWGIYQVYFPKPVRTIEDMRECFIHILPALQARYKKFHTRAGK